MVDQLLVNDLKEIINKGANSADPDDILKIFELYKQISKEVDYLKQDLDEEKMDGQIVFEDIDRKYWLKASEGRIEYGEGKIKKPLFTIAASKDVGMGLFLCELDANIVTPLGKLKAGGKIKNLRAFQEFYEDAIEEFKKRY
ncbi:MAG: hypothetical protein EU548_00505 [Promethearchaeota archaeon]|nr:MAG: hypothetical protein EU548_00505 [Candidatus Lokiarchaeota archaeon]